MILRVRRMELAGRRSRQNEVARWRGLVIRNSRVTTLRVTRSGSQVLAYTGRTSSLHSSTNGASVL